MSTGTQFEDKDMTGFLFRNKEKKEEKHPDFKGHGKVHGRKVQLAAWTKVDKKGEKFLSVKFDEPFVPRSNGGRRPEPSNEEVF